MYYVEKKCNTSMEKGDLQLDVCPVFWTKNLADKVNAFESAIKKRKIYPAKNCGLPESSTRRPG
jgi:hypothetical protein